MKDLGIVEEHRYTPAYNGPGYCTGCDWESLRIGISSEIQFGKHIYDLISD